MSLNFNGNYIGGVPSGGGEGGTTNHAQLTNLDYANSGHTGFMKNDASNLTTVGKNVFDGQWVESKDRITTDYENYPTAQDVEYDISNYLPDDDYNYEVIISGAVRSDTNLGDYSRIELASDIFPSVIIADAKCVVAGQYSACSSATIIPVGAQRKLKIFHLTWAKGTYSLWISGYRRIGTNQ